MSLAHRAFEASHNMRPVQPRAASLPFGWPNDAIFYAPGYLGLISLPQADNFERMLTTPTDMIGRNQPWSSYETRW